MRRLALIALAAVLAACDPAPPINTNEAGDDVNIVIDECTDADNEVCK